MSNGSFKMFLILTVLLSVLHIRPFLIFYNKIHFFKQNVIFRFISGLTLLTGEKTH